MNKKILFAVLIVAAVGTLAFFVWQGKLKQNEKLIPSTPNMHSLQNEVKHTTVDTTAITALRKSIIPSKLKTYSNAKLGFSFQYSDRFTKVDDDVLSVNRFGETTSVEVNFTDSKTSTTFSVACYLMKGKELYQYAVSQLEAKKGWYAKDAEKIEVAGNNAIKANMILAVDGRGNKLKTPMKLEVIDFINKKQAIEIQIQFKTPLANVDTERADFNRLLTSFKFTD